MLGKEVSLFFRSYVFSKTKNKKEKNKRESKGLKNVNRFIEAYLQLWFVLSELNRYSILLTSV